MAEVLTEVPESLKNLARMCVKKFYGVDHELVMDVLIHNPCICEEDMLELLKFDPNKLRYILNTFEMDEFVKCRIRPDTAPDPDGKTTRHSYYFIDYRALVIRVRYKLDRMRQMIEENERKTSWVYFMCPSCSSSYTELQADQLLDITTGTMFCTSCPTELKQAFRPSELAWFNEKMKHIYKALYVAECMKLSHYQLEPKHTDILALKQSRKRALYTQNVVIIIGEQDEQNKQRKAPKEQPVWFTQSTVQGACSEPENLNNRGQVVPGAQDETMGQGMAQADKNEEVMRALLTYEKCGSLASDTAVTIISDIDTSDSDDDSPPGPPTATASQHRADKEDEDEEVGYELMVLDD